MPSTYDSCIVSLKKLKWVMFYSGIFCYCKSRLKLPKYLFLRPMAITMYWGQFIWKIAPAAGSIFDLQTLIPTKPIGQSKVEWTVEPDVFGALSLTPSWTHSRGNKKVWVQMGVRDTVHPSVFKEKNWKQWQNLDWKPIQSSIGIIPWYKAYLPYLK